MYRNMDSFFIFLFVVVVCFCFFLPPSACDRAELLCRQQVGSQCSAILCLCDSIITLLFYNWRSLVHWWRTHFILFSSYWSFLDVMWWTCNPVGVFSFFLFLFSPVILNKISFWKACPIYSECFRVFHSCNSLEMKWRGAFLMCFH